MKKIIFILLCFGSIGISQICKGQNPQAGIDSLLNVLRTAEEDTNKANLLNQLASSYTFSDPEKSFKYSSEGLALAQRLESRKYIVQSYQNMSVYYFNTGNPQLGMEYMKKAIPLIEMEGDTGRLADCYSNMSNAAYMLNDYYEAFSYSKKALEFSEEIRDSSRIANILTTIGNNYRDITSDYTTALNYFFRAIDLYIAKKDSLGLGYNYFSIATVYSMEHNNDKAYEYYTLSLDLAEKQNNQLQVADCMNRLGNIQFIKNDFNKAKEYYSNALKISETIQYYAGLFESNDGLAKVYSSTGKFDKAIESENKVMKVAEQIGDKYAISSTYIGFSDIYFKVFEYNKANEYLKQGLALADEIGRIDLQRDIYIKLAENSKLMKNYKAAYEFQSNYIKLNDSIAGEQTLKKTAELQASYDSEKKEKEILQLTKDKEIQNSEIKKQKLQKYSFIGGLGLVIVLMLFGYRFYRTRQVLRLQSIRNKISGDLHDDIGSTLNSISIYSEVARKKDEQQDEALEMIGEASRKIIDAMSDIVWTINPDNDSFDKIIFRMKSLAYNLLRAKKIEFTFHSEEILNEKKLSLGERRNFYLIFKEAVNNLVKYSNATRVAITLSNENDYIKLRIQDDGVGFDASEDNSGNGLKNMKRRANEMKAQFKIESSKGNGTQIELILKA